MFTVTMLPAAVGDCLWIEYGDESNPRRILIDCGTPPTYRQTLRSKIDALGSKAEFELLIVTHVDTDHIGGVLPLFSDPPPNLRIGEVWFNAWPQIQPEALDLLGPLDGEVLSQQLASPRFPWRSGARWNTRFRRKGHPAAIPTTGRLSTHSLAGGMKLTLLSPGKVQLELLRAVWEQVCKDGGLVPGIPSSRLDEIAAKKGVDFLGGDPVRDLADTKTGMDPTEANGSTIAVLAEYEDEGRMKRCIFAGDAHADVLAPSITRLANQRGQDRLDVDVFKLPHHGSENNVTTELIESVNCKRYLFSSNGGVFSHPHPHAPAVARAILSGGPDTTLFFNYRSKTNEIWDNGPWMRQYHYEVDYGDEKGTCQVTV
jgi:hypothetical protein